MINCECSRARKFMRDLRISHTIVQRILKDDLKLRSHRGKAMLKTSEQLKAKRLKLANWIRTNFRKENTLTFFCFLTKNCSTSMEFITHKTRDSEHQIVPKLMQKVTSRKYRNFRKTLWSALEYVRKEYPLLLIFEEGTVDHERYIQKVLPVPLTSGNDMFGNNWTFQHDGGRAHIHQNTQDWCRTDLSSFIEKEHWVPNIPDLNLPNYRIRVEFAGGCQLGSRDI